MNDIILVLIGGAVGLGLSILFTNFIKKGRNKKNHQRRY